MKNDVHELQLYFCPFGYLDMQRACEIGDAVRIPERELFEIIDDFKYECDLHNYNDIDPVYCIMEHILQLAKNKIEELTGYDFTNDYSGK